MAPPALLTLVLGGARSGKSRHAEALARNTGLARVYVATADAYDDGMAARIAHHQSQRQHDGWHTLEAQHDLRSAIIAHSAPGAVLLVDCLTLWLSNRLLAEADLAAETAALGEALAARRGPVVCVSNEVGLSVVPDNALARAFRDHQGRLNQQVAALATRVDFVAAGLPLTLKEVI